MLGTRIANLRKERGYTQAELAGRLHISASALGMYEQGRRVPGVQILLGLSQHLEVSLDYLMTGKEYSGHSNPPGCEGLRGTCCRRCAYRCVGTKNFSTISDTEKSFL